jgi:hypothetical protein
MSQLHEFRRRLEAHKAAFVEPCLPTLADKPPTGPAGAGVHLIAATVSLGLTAIRQWKRRSPPCLARACIIDGEVVVTDERGVAVFDQLRYDAGEAGRVSVRVRPARTRRPRPKAREAGKVESCAASAARHEAATEPGDVSRPTPSCS